MRATTTERAGDGSNLVGPDDACPCCGQRDADQLIWQGDDGDYVLCAACGTFFAPPTTPPQAER